MTAVAPPRRSRRLVTSEAIPGGREVFTWHVDKPAERSMRTPGAPRWPWQVDPELYLLRKFVSIVEAHYGDVDAMTAAYASVLREVEAREQGRLSVADRRRDGQPIYPMSDELRALFGQPDPVRALVGGDDGTVGLACLTMNQRDALWLHLHGFSRAAIAEVMAPKRTRRFGRAGALSLKTVSEHLWQARKALRAVFALASEHKEAYMEALDAEEMAAQERKRAVDPARARPEQRPLKAWPLPGEQDWTLIPMPEDEENPDQDAENRRYHRPEGD